MDRVIRIRGHDPLTTIELITAVFLVVGGFYVLFGFLDVSVLLSNAPGVIKSLGSAVGLAALGFVSTIIGFLHIYGIYRYNYKLRAAMLFSHIMVRLYTIIAVIAAQGVFPLDWLNSLIITCILTVCYLIVKRKIRFYHDTGT